MDVVFNVEEKLVKCRLEMQQQKEIIKHHQAARFLLFTTFSSTGSELCSK